MISYSVIFVNDILSELSFTAPAIFRNASSSNDDAEACKIVRRPELFTAF